MSGHTPWTWLRTLLRGLALAATALTQWLPGAALASVTALTAALWLWAGTEGSLRQALAVAAPMVPELDQLDWTGLEATLRDGGQAEELVWQQNGLKVVVSQPRFSWHFLPLLMGQPLALELRASAVRVSDQRPASPEPLTPPGDLDLPVALGLDFDVGPIFWGNHPTRPPTPLAQRLRGRYTYTENDNGDDEHHIRFAEIRAAQGNYQGDVRVLSEAPLTLVAQIGGTVTPPAHTNPPGWAATAQVRFTGDLHGPEATLALSAQVDSPANGPKADLQAQLQPWQGQPLRRVHAQLHRLDLATFWTELPHTLLTGNAHAEPGGGQTPRWTVSADLSNGIPGTWDHGRLPLAKLSVQAHGNAASGEVQRLEAHTGGGGSLSGQGNWMGAVWQGKLQAQGVQLAELDTRLPQALLQGTLQAKQRTTGGKRPSTTTEATLETTATATPSPSGKYLDSKQIISIKRQAAISSKIKWDGRHLGLYPLKLVLDSATLQAHGELTPHTRSWNGEAQLQAPGLQVSSQGHLAPDTGKGQLSLNVEDGAALARWVGGMPVVGQVLGLRTGQPLPTGQGQGHVSWDGGWLKPALQLDARLLLHKLTLPATATASTWGARELAITLTGNPDQWQASAQGQLHRPEFGALLNLSLTGRTPGLAPVAKGAEIPSPSRHITVSQLAIDLGPRRGPPTLRVTNAQPLVLDWRGRQANLAAGTLGLRTLGTHPLPQLSSLSWDASTWGPGGLSTSGRFSGVGVLPWSQTLANLGIPVAHQTLKSAGVGGDLTLQGNWQLSLPGTLAQPPQGRLQITRQAGDLQVDEAIPPANAPGQRLPAAAAALPLGLTQASVELSAQGEDLHLHTQWESTRAGQVKARWFTRLTPGPQTMASGWWPQRGAPLSGQVQATVPELGVWSRLAPPGWRVRGQLELNAAVSGTLGQPDWRGELSGNRLELQSVVEGLVFGQGTLRARLGGDGMEITQFKLEGEGGEASGGSLQLIGQARWPGTPHHGDAAPTPSVALQATAHRLRVSARADRRLTLSGQAKAQLDQGLLTLRGRLKADQAQFILPDETTPSLGQDVVVRLTQAAAPAPTHVPLRTDVSMQIDLGPQFEVRGQGLQTRLSGELTVTSPTRSEGFQVVGEVRAVDGTYRAYGQPLRIEEGVLRFSGPYDDPALEVLALRGKGTPGSGARNPTGNTLDNQQVGVRITGSARTPRVALYASPELPDSEKLAWLVLGRPASGVGAETAVLQQAALALLSGQNGRGLDGSLASTLGLDDISLRGDTTQRSDGSVGQTTAITLGKRLSSKLYVAYEQGLNSTLSAVNVFYDVSHRLTVRAQAGHESALDLIFTLQRD